MRRRGARIALQYAGVLFVAIVLNFALPRLAPGDAVDYLLPPEAAGEVTAAQRESVLAQYGLGGSPVAQFGSYLSRLAEGDLGVSIRYGQPVTEVLTERIGWTLLLVGGALALSTLLGVLLGFFAAWRRGSKSDTTSLTGVMVIDAMPPFFVGLLAILVFSVSLGWLPIFGALPATEASGLALVLEAGQRLILPLVTLTLGFVGTVYLIARASLVGELQEDYVIMAEAKGLSPRQVRRHAQRNALLPVVTITLVGLGTLIGGAAVVETVFSYPGLGRLIYESVLARDYPVLQGAFLLLAVAVLLCNFVADLLYPLLDPRLRRPVAQ
ncbi:MAG: ABC transporter permease [Solirubrobacteraceae bacterium MAG38_C4-C5]|nr:ABC transporter permease [Candidatus Siliceabacter maunaloa]